MAKKTPVDPLRARFVELTEEVETRLGKLREFGIAPGNTWLAKGELQAISMIVNDLDSLLDDIKEDDAESGY